MHYTKLKRAQKTLSAAILALAFFSILIASVLIYRQTTPQDIVGYSSEPLEGGLTNDFNDPADLTGDGCVDNNDLDAVVGYIKENSPAGDVSQDGNLGIEDIIQVIAAMKENGCGSGTISDGSFLGNEMSPVPSTTIPGRSTVSPFAPRITSVSLTTGSALQTRKLHYIKWRVQDDTDLPDAIIYNYRIDFTVWQPKWSNNRFVNVEGLLSDGKYHFIEIKALDTEGYESEIVTYQFRDTGAEKAHMLSPYPEPMPLIAVTNPTEVVSSISYRLVIDNIEPKQPTIQVPPSYSEVPYTSAVPLNPNGKLDEISHINTDDSYFTVTKTSSDGKVSWDTEYTQTETRDVINDKKNEQGDIIYGTGDRTIQQKTTRSIVKTNTLVKESDSNFLFDGSEGDIFYSDDKSNGDFQRYSLSILEDKWSDETNTWEIVPVDSFSPTRPFEVDDKGDEIPTSSAWNRGGNNDYRVESVVDASGNRRDTEFFTVDVGGNLEFLSINDGQQYQGGFSIKGKLVFVYPSKSYYASSSQFLSKDEPIEIWLIIPLTQELKDEYVKNYKYASGSITGDKLSILIYKADFINVVPPENVDLIPQFIKEFGKK